MKLKKEVVAQVVSEASTKMSDPNYSAVMVGGFVQSQTSTSQFITAHQKELGGAEAIVNVIFHAALLGQCFQRGVGRSVRALSFEDLDSVAGGDTLATLEMRQPSLHEFITSNVENDDAKKLLALIALAFDHAS
jgi:hypothetical protein